MREFNRKHKKKQHRRLRLLKHQVELIMEKAWGRLHLDVPNDPPFDPPRFGPADPVHQLVPRRSELRRSETLYCKKWDANAHHPSAYIKPMLRYEYEYAYDVICGVLGGYLIVVAIIVFSIALSFGH